MIRASIVAAVLLASGSLLSAKDYPDAQPLLDSALQQAQLFERVASPFSLEVDFTAQSDRPMQGHLTLRWESKDHWWTNVTMNGFDLTQIRNGEWEYTLRNHAYTPMLVHELFGLLHIGTNWMEVTSRKVRVRKMHGVQMDCVEVKFRKSNEASGELCLDPTSHELLSKSWQVSQVEHEETFFSDYFDFDGQRYPRELDLSVNGAESISAKVTDLRLAAFDPALLSQPVGAIVRRKCPDMKPPHPLGATMPSLRPLWGPTGPKSNIAQVALTIMADGSVGDIQVIGGSSGEGGQSGVALDASYLTALKQAKFQPAMCGDEAVSTDITIQIQSRVM